MPARRAHRLLALLLVAILALSLAACTGDSDEAPTPPATATATPAETASPTPMPPTSTPTVTATPTIEPTATRTPSPAATPSPTPTPTPSPSPTATPTETATATPAESTRTFRYTTYDTSGAAAEPGSYAFLADPADTSSAVTTYEGLRDGTATALRIHETDADGVSRAAFLDSVEAGDLFEWRQADDCFVRYTVTELLRDPSGTPRRLLGVEWMTYAFTGCSGPIAAEAAVSVDLGELPDLGGVSLTAPVVHGIFQIVPEDWDGAVEPVEERAIPGDSRATPASYATIEEARASLPFWRTPTVPEGWKLEGAVQGAVETPNYGYCSFWLTDVKDWVNPPRRTPAFDLCGLYAGSSGSIRDASWLDGEWATETRIIAGRPAIIQFSPPGAKHDRFANTGILVYDAAAEAVYSYLAWDYTLYGSNVEASIGIVRSLFEPPNPLPPQTTFRYTTYDTTGAVTEPGSYAFLADPADNSSVVTTYEGLRDGTATALRIHATDADGVSRAAFLDSVEAGDLFEWRQAEDCFVRYTVTDLLPEPSGTPRRLLGVEWMTYAFTGCNGPIAPDAAATVDWGELPDLGGTSLTVPVVHGAFQLVPEGWAGAVRPGEVHELPSGASYPSAGLDTDSLSVARGLPYWRDPALPTSWTFSTARGGGYDVSYGYCAAYASEEGHLAVRVCGEHAWDVRWAEEASWLARGGSGELLQGAAETRTVAGRAALASYSPPGPNHSDSFTVTLRVYDAATQSVYTVIGFDPSLLGSNVEGAFAIARSLFEPPNPP